MAKTVPALDISLLDLTFPTETDEVRQRTFRTLSNYIEAWKSYLDDDIGVRPQCPLEVIVSAKQFPSLAKKVQFEEAKRFLSLSWATEVLMHLNLTTLGQTESIRYAVGGHEILPVGGHGTARWRPRKLPSGGHEICPSGVW